MIQTLIDTADKRPKTKLVACGINYNLFKQKLEFDMNEDIIQKTIPTAPNYMTSIFPLLFSWLDMGVDILQLPCLSYILSILPDSEADWESVQKLNARVPTFLRTLFLYALKYLSSFMCSFGGIWRPCRARRVTTITFLLQKGIKIPSEEGYQLLLRNIYPTPQIRYLRRPFWLCILLLPPIMLYF